MQNEKTYLTWHMLQDVTLRTSSIAYLYRENPTLKREDNLSFYDRVTTSGVEIVEFSIQGPELVLARRPAPVKGGIEVRVGSFGPGPVLRLLVTETPGSATAEMTRQNADLIWSAFQACWGSQVGQPALTEITLQLTAPAPANDSFRYLINSVAKVGEANLHHLGRSFQGFGLRFMSGMAVHTGPGVPPVLSGADVNVQIETYLQDPTQIFILATAKWPAVTVPTSQLPEPLRSQVGENVLQLNLVGEPPSRRLGDVYNFVTKDLISFMQTSAED